MARTGVLDVDFFVRSNAATRQGGSNGIQACLDAWPRRGAQDQNRDPPGAEVLLIAQVLVSGDEQIIAGLLRACQQLPVCHG